MADYNEYDERGGLSRSGFLGALLDYSGWIVIGVSLGWGIFRIVQLREAEDTSVILGTFALAILGVVLGAVVWAIGEIVRRLPAIMHAIEGLPSSASPASAPAAPSAARVDSEAFGEMLLLLREVRDISLLTEAQRVMRLEAQGKAALTVLQRDVPQLLREHNWIEARNRVQEARERFPSFKEWDELEGQIQQMRSQVEARDVESAERQIRDLTALAAWDRVGEVLHELMQRHPDSAKANELAQRVRQQRSKVEAEQRARLMAQTQEAASKHNWDEAINLASAVIQRFPRSPEAQLLKMDLPLLRENHEIKTRKQLESQYQHMVTTKRFDEALRIAHEILRQYPGSPQASALKEQIPRLEQRLSGAARA